MVSYSLFHQNFYIGTRRFLTHEVCDSRNTKKWFNPETIAEWMAFPSGKLCVTVGIVVHHLANDNAQPLRITHDRDLEVNPDAAVAVRSEGLPKDRIVIYSAFPSSSNVIMDVSNSSSYVIYTILTPQPQVLKLYGVEALEFNGSMTDKARSDSLAAFKDEKAGTPRVMLLSNVGTTGLNLDFANVLIIIVCASYANTNLPTD